MPPSKKTAKKYEAQYPILGAYVHFKPGKGFYAFALSQIEDDRFWTCHKVDVRITKQNIGLLQEEHDKQMLQLLGDRDKHRENKNGGKIITEF